MCVCVCCAATDGLQFKLSVTVDKKQYLVEVQYILYTLCVCALIRGGFLTYLACNK